MLRSPHVTARRVVEASKYALVGALAFLAVTSAANPTGAAAERPGVATEEMASSPVAQTRVDRLMALHDCSVTGFGADVIPGSSLVLQDDKVRHVSFDEGWAVYTGEQDGVLLALCRPTL